MASTVTGNAGGASAQGATITASPLNSALSGPQFAVADSSGNFTFSLAAGSYILSADTRNITTGAFIGFVYRSLLPLTVDGTTSLSGMNFAQPVNPNSTLIEY